MMVGDLGPAKPGHSVGPHRAENIIIVNGRVETEQCLVYVAHTQSQLLPVIKLPSSGNIVGTDIWILECTELIQLSYSQGPCQCHFS